MFMYLIYKYYSNFFDKYLNKLKSVLPKYKSTYWIDVYRISHSLIVLILAIQLIELIPFTYYNEDDLLLNNLKYLHYFWILISVLIFLGTQSRFIFIIYFILNYHLLGGNIGDYMLKVSSFWMVFIIPSFNFVLKCYGFKILGFSIKGKKVDTSWAMFLFGLNISFIITISGIFKLIDPVWISGYGFYYAYIQPWIHVEWTSFIVNSEAFVLFMNYTALLFESSVFFLYIFSKTRTLSILFMFGFILLVNFPLRIDPVGPAGLTSLFALLSFYKIKIPFIPKIR